MSILGRTAEPEQPPVAAVFEEIRAALAAVGLWFPSAGPARKGLRA
ncbi:hypothetical protein ACFVUH_18580 [Kitasatospora sp. NPDC058032]